MNIIGDSHTTEHAEICSLTRTARLIGDTWTLMIVHNLMSGSKRFGELLEALGNVSPKTLSQRLKLLEEVKLLTRQAYAEIPPRVEYSLTEKGLALVNIIKAMQDFGERYLSDIAPVPPASCQSESTPSEQL